jgi:excisionase family DNA binding protein
MASQSEEDREIPKKCSNLSIDEAAALWNVSRITVWRWIKRGVIKADKTNRGYRVLPGQEPPAPD